MIEGIIIVALIAFMIAFVFISNPLYATAVGTIDSIVASALAVWSGVAALLTNWWYWAIDPAKYAAFDYSGVGWLLAWVSLLVFAGYSIATSDRGWRNAVGKKSNYLGFILALFLLLQPVAVSYGSTYLADYNAYVESDYNITEVMTPAATYYMTTSVTNASTTLYETQATVFDNDTKDMIIASLVFDSMTARTASTIQARMNTTFFADISISKVEVEWYYIGTGNITKIMVVNALTPYNTIHDWTTSISYDTNGTVTWIPAPFETQLLKTLTKLDFRLYFTDASHLPTNGGYVQMAVHVYTTNTLYSAELITNSLAWLLTFVNFGLLAYTSGAYGWVRRQL